MVRVGGGTAELPRGFRSNTGLLPQFGNGVDAAGVAAGNQLGVDARAAVADLELGMDGTDLHEQKAASLLPALRGPRRQA